MVAPTHPKLSVRRPGSQDDPREDAAPVPETLEGPGAQPEEIAADAARK